MNHKPTVIVDADAIVAQANTTDANFQKALKIANTLLKLKANVLYPITAIAEATTVLQHKFNSSRAYEIAQIMSNPDVHILEVNKQTLTNALRFFSPTTSKKNTLFDCIVAALAEEHKADAIFSFDRFYTKKGFKLAKDLKF